MNQDRTKRKLTSILSADVVGYRRLAEGAEASQNMLDTVREDILDILLIAITFVAIPPLATSLYRSVNIGWQDVMYLQIVVYLLLFITTLLHRKIPFLYKALIVISLCFLIGSTGIIEVGLLSSGAIFMLFSVILATMFLGVRYGGVFIFASLVLLITVTLGVNQGWIKFDFDIGAAALTPSLWIMQISAFAFFTVILIFSLGRLINYLLDSSNILRERTLELKRTNERVLEEIEEKKRTEDELRKSEEKYRILYESATDGICVAQDGVIKFPNPMLEKITGYSKEELTQKPFTDFIHHEDRAIVLDRHMKRLSGEEPPSTY
jgi:PAS domain-containing protein